MSHCCQSIEPAAAGASAGAARSHSAPLPWWRLIVAIVLAGNLMVFSLAVNVGHAAPNHRLFLHVVLAAVTLLVAELVGRPLLRGSWRSLVERRVAVEQLFVLGVVGALGLSVAAVVAGEGDVYFEVVAILLVIYALGAQLKSRSQQRSLAQLRTWLPVDETARVRRCCGKESVVPVEDVALGATVVVHPGERVAVDGVVREGAALVRADAITGEPHVQPVARGDRVLAGSVCVDGSLHIDVDTPIGDRVLDRIVDGVEQAWSRPAPIQQAADRWAGRFVPFVVLASLATFAGWAAATDVATGLWNGLAVLLVACPCALGFATPLAVWTAIDQLARRGMIVRSGDVVEALSTCDTVFFDKTGTLTRGELEVARFDVVDSDEGCIADLVVAIEERTEHPVARALRRLDAPRQTPWVVDRLELLAGRGIRAHVRERQKLHEVTITVEGGGDDRHLRVELDGRLVARAVLREHVGPELAALQRALKARGVRAGVVSGDAASRTHATGFEIVHGGASPEDKAIIVEQRQCAGEQVLFVGDGVNDAVALATAQVGVAMATGTDLAREVGDAQWLRDEVSSLPTALDVARRAMHVARSNIRFAAVYNVVGMSVAAAGLLHPVWAALLMTASSLFVTWRTVLALDDTQEAHSAPAPKTVRERAALRPAMAE